MSANEHDDDQPDEEDVIERLRAENARLRRHLQRCADRIKSDVADGEYLDDYEQAIAALKTEAGK